MTIESGLELERQIAAIYRTLGARVMTDVALAGNQIDVMVQETTSSGAETRTIVEAKDFARPVGGQTVRSFAAVTDLLRRRGLVDKGLMVSRAGFSGTARKAAETHGIELLEIADLEQRVRGKLDEVEQARREIKQEQLEAKASASRPKHVFVVMPFASEFDDVYVLGIRDVAERMGLVVERADDIEHNENILDLIQSKIRAADAVIADTTGNNPNVFYEVGYSHAAEIPTILISRRGSKVPFDLRLHNHIFYQNIVDLRERLKRRLKATLSL